MKCHVFCPNSEKVEFTLRYWFILPEKLLKKAKIKIDRQTGADIQKEQSE